MCRLLLEMWHKCATTGNGGNVWGFLEMVINDSERYVWQKWLSAAETCPFKSGAYVVPQSVRSGTAQNA